MIKYAGIRRASEAHIHLITQDYFALALASRLVLFIGLGANPFDEKWLSRYRFAPFKRIYLTYGGIQVETDGRKSFEEHEASPTQAINQGNASLPSLATVNPATIENNAVKSAMARIKERAKAVHASHHTKHTSHSRYNKGW